MRETTCFSGLGLHDDRLGKFRLGFPEKGEGSFNDDNVINYSVPGSVGLVVAAATEEQGRHVAGQDQVDASTDAVDGEVEPAERVEGEAVGAALRHDGARLEGQDDFVVKPGTREAPRS